MFCYKCGKEIDNEAVVCVHCGVSTRNLNKDKEKNIIINSSSSSSSSASSNIKLRQRRYYSPLLDTILIFLTCGLWLIWMIIRPKYY